MAERKILTTTITSNVELLREKVDRLQLLFDEIKAIQKEINDLEIYFDITEHLSNREVKDFLTEQLAPSAIC